MRLGYICTNFNNSHFTVEAVRSLCANERHQYDIVVVDNQSDELSRKKLDELAKEFPQVHVIFNTENLGYFRGLNVGIKHLRDYFPDTRWVVIGNNDLEFGARFADDVELHLERLSAHAVISPDIITIDGEHQNPHVISSISPLREIFYDLYYSNYYLGLLIHKLARLLPKLSERADESQWGVPRPIYQGHGSCYILSPVFFEHFDELWAPTFLMSEEYFLSKQLSDVGLQIYYDPAIKVTHHWHASLSQLPGKSRWAMARDAHREYRKYVGIRGPIGSKS